MYKNIMNDLGQLRTVVSKSYIYNLIQNQTGLSIRTISHVLNHTKEQDWSRLRAVPAPAKGTPSPGWGQLGRGNDVRVKYVSINSGLGGDRL